MVIDLEQMMDLAVFVIVDIGIIDICRKGIAVAGRTVSGRIESVDIIEPHLGKEGTLIVGAGTVDQAFIVKVSGMSPGLDGRSGPFRIESGIQIPVDIGMIFRFRQDTAEIRFFLFEGLKHVFGIGCESLNGHFLFVFVRKDRIGIGIDQFRHAENTDIQDEGGCNGDRKI